MKREKVRKGSAIYIIIKGHSIEKSFNYARVSRDELFKQHQLTTYMVFFVNLEKLEMR